MNTKLMLTNYDKEMDIIVYEVKRDEKYYGLYKNLFLNCEIILFMFDLTKYITFEKIKEIITYVEDLQGLTKKIVKFILGNKSDDEENRKVPREEIKDFICQNEIEYIEISLKNMINIEVIIDNIMYVCNINDRGKELRIFESEKYDKRCCLFAETVYKIILLGDSTVGKTSFFNQYFCDDFTDNNLVTVGTYDKHKLIKINDDLINMQIWDTAGQERFRCLIRSYYKNADGIILMYDVTNKQTFENVTKWMKDIIDNTFKKIVIYLVGNKIDLVEDRAVDFQEATEVASKYGVKIIEISVRYNINIRDVIIKIMREIYEKNQYTPQNNNLGCSRLIRNKGYKSGNCCNNSN